MKPLNAYVTDAIEKADSWLNVMTGMGGARDKSAATVFCAGVTPLSPEVLSAMYQTEDLSAKIVDVYPQEAMSEGFEVDSGDDGDEQEVCDYLERFEVGPRFTDGEIWARLYGGALGWVLTDDDADPSEPLPEVYTCTGIKFVDKRFAAPAPGVENRDAQGFPTAYDIYPDGVFSTLQGARVYRVHVSRLVRLHGARTEKRTQVALNGWDLSVLQRPYNALRSDGAMWKATEALVNEASTGVVTIRDLQSMMGAGQKNALLERLRQMAINRSIVKDVVLNGGRGPNDEGKEEYHREPVQFAGLPDLTEQGLQRVAAAAEVPVTILLGQAPAGLNATGDSDLRWFLKRVNAYRRLRIAPPLTRLLRILLGAADAPKMPRAADGKIIITIRWPELWGPNAKEKSEIYSANAAADVSYIDKGVLLPEEIALSRFGDDGYSQEVTIDRDLRQEALDADKLPPEGDGENEGEQPPGAAPAGTDTSVQQTAMNGTQVTSLLEVVSMAAKGEISRESALQVLQVAFQVTPEVAAALLGPETFEPTKPEPAPSPFGGGPPRPPSAPSKEEVPNGPK